MKNIVLVLFLCSCAFSLSAQSSYSEVSGNTTPESSGISTIDPSLAPPSSGVDFYADVASFDAGCGNSTARVDEDFATSVLPPNTVAACGTNLNSSTNDACFAPGDIVPGVDITSNFITPPTPDMVIVTTGFLGATSNAVGPNTFGDNLIINFTAPANAVSLELWNPLGAGDVDVEVYGSSGLLGNLPIVGVGGTPVFVGIVASEDITSIVVNDVTPALAVLMQNLSFDVCGADEVVPTLGEWSLIVLGLMMMIVGIVAVTQRKTAIA